MKRLLRNGLLLVPGLLAVICGLSVADAAWLGANLASRDQPYVVRVQSEGQVSLTVFTITSRGKYEVSDVLVLDPTVGPTPGSTSVTLTVPRGAIRVILSLASEHQTTVTVNSSPQIVFATHEEIVFDPF